MTNQGVAAGFIIRDNLRALFSVGASNLGNTSILIAEVTTMRQGVYTAIQSSYKNILIEGDSKIVIQVVQGEISAPWVIHTLIQDI